MGLAALVFSRHNGNVFPGQIDIFSRQYIGALHHQVFTGGHADIAQYTAHRTADVGDGFAGVGDFGAVAADRDPNTASAHQARFFLLKQVRLTFTLLRGADGNILLRAQANVVVSHHITADDGDIFTTDIHRAG
ncbi:Uncharacterised protein [Yersinia frederiksenii]|nr:Uncharacterised protein [Yersinia frederiksenii]